MSRWVPFIVPVGLLMALLLGLSFPARPEPPLNVVRQRPAVGAMTLRPGESTSEAVRFLRTLRSDPPPPAPPPIVVIAPPPPPPPPDVSEIFRAALSAIERDPDTSGFRVLVRDPAAPEPQITIMRTGDRFADGWRITQISQDSVTLRRGRDSRRVGLFR